MPLTPPAPIETPRLVVRQITEADLPGLMAVNGDDTVTQFLPYATWRSIDDATAWYQRITGIQATGNAVQFVILSRAERAVGGAGQVFNMKTGRAPAGEGCVQGQAEWGRGLAREAVGALVGTAFGAMGVRRLEAEVNPLNQPSVRLLQSLGFTREGLLRQRWVGKGKTYDVELHGLLSAEWQPAR